METLTNSAYKQRVLDSFSVSSQGYEMPAEKEFARMRALIERYEKTLEIIARSDPDYDALHVISLARSALEAKRTLNGLS